MALLVQSVCGGKKANANHIFSFFFLKHKLEQDGQKPLHILAHTPAKSSQMHTFSNAYIYSSHTVQGKTTNCSILTHKETNRSQLFSNKKSQVLAPRQPVTHTLTQNNWPGFESLVQQGLFLPESTYSADSLTQTPSTGLQHPSFNHCHI